MVDYLYLNPIRSFARRIGVIKLVSVPAQARGLWRRLEYERGRPTELDIEVGGHSCSMLVADALEYSRVCSFRDDRPLLNAILAKLVPGDTYWDVGASIGLYTCIVSKAVGPSGRVVSFEPERRSFERLEQNIAANNLHNVKALKVALWNTRKTLRLNVSHAASAGTHSLHSTEANSPAATEKVDALPGDELRIAEGLPVPAVMKVDVEGAEEEVFTGLNATLREPACRAVLCEVHFTLLEKRGQSNAPQRITSFLGDCGFGSGRWIDHSHYLAEK